ncbi:unnamed protein product [Darwinula stevensoni]|uniref:Uncharacterized protein n=1 Tax=Darwinula stevensoni TaxID=69355 RepID=A0A7R8X2U9_9CRUS|nr:unnamed protein product [Darwinula stevensoni]CAG0884295.1 unnamed protein product [Darwinula stevensoni]
MPIRNCTELKIKGIQFPALEGDVIVTPCPDHHYGHQRWTCSEDGFVMLENCTSFTDWIDDLRGLLNDSNIPDILPNLTLAVEGVKDLSGEEIEKIVDLLNRLFEAFNHGLVGDDMLQQNANRTKTFTSLLRTISRSSLDLSEKLLMGFDEELEFVAAQSTFLIEVHGQKKGARSNPLIFPSTESKTYLKLPGTSEGDSDGNHYSYVGVLYAVQNLDQLLPGHQNVNENSTLVNPSQQLCLCLLLGQICLFLLIDRYIFNLSEVGCAITGMFMHLIFLCVFMWLALECLSIYRKLVGKPKRFRLSTRAHFIIGYGVPFGIVCITASVSFGTRTHGYGAGEL